MRFCEICRDPAVRHGVSTNGHQQKTARYYCYVHAKEVGLLDGPLAALTPVAATTGYSTNAVVFVLEALGKRGCVTAEGGPRPRWSMPVPTKTAEQFCIAVRLGVIDQFDFHEHLVLNHWKLIRGKDIGVLLSRLAEAGVLAMQTHTIRVLKNLRAVQRELITFPYDQF